MAEGELVGVAVGEDHDGVVVASDELARLPAYVTKAEAAAVARVHVRTIERAIASGQLVAGGPRGARRIALATLQAWLAGGGVAVLAVLAVLCVACGLGVEHAQDVMRALGCPFAD